MVCKLMRPKFQCLPVSHSPAEIVGKVEAWRRASGHPGGMAEEGAGA